MVRRIGVALLAGVVGLLIYFIAIPFFLGFAPILGIAAALGIFAVAERFGLLPDPFEPNLRSYFEENRPDTTTEPEPQDVNPAPKRRGPVHAVAGALAIAYLFFPLYYWGFVSLWRSSPVRAGWVRSLLGDPFVMPVSVRIAISILCVCNSVLLFAFITGHQKALYGLWLSGVMWAALCLASAQEPTTAALGIIFAGGLSLGLYYERVRE